MARKRKGRTAAAKTPNTHFTTKKYTPIKLAILPEPKKKGQKYKPLSSYTNKYNQVVPYANVVQKFPKIHNGKKKP